MDAEIDAPKAARERAARTGSAFSSAGRAQHGRDERSGREKEARARAELGDESLLLVEASERSLVAKQLEATLHVGMIARARAIVCNKS